MKSFLIIAAVLLISLQLVSAQVTTGTIVEYTNLNCTTAGGSPVEPTVTAVSGTCYASGMTSVMITCGSTNSASFYTNSTTCATGGFGNMLYSGGGAPGACVALNNGAGAGMTSIYVKISCTTTGAASTVSVSALVLAVLAIAAHYMKF